MRHGDHRATIHSTRNVSSGPDLPAGVGQPQHPVAGAAGVSPSRQWPSVRSMVGTTTGRPRMPGAPGGDVGEVVVGDLHGRAADVSAGGAQRSSRSPPGAAGTSGRCSSVVVHIASSASSGPQRQRQVAPMVWRISCHLLGRRSAGVSHTCNDHGSRYRSPPHGSPVFTVSMRRFHRVGPAKVGRGRRRRRCSRSNFNPMVVSSAGQPGRRLPVPRSDRCISISGRLLGGVRGGGAGGQPTVRRRRS